MLGGGHSTPARQAFGLLWRPSSVLPSPNMMHFFTNEFPSGRARDFAFSFVSSRAFNRFLVGHV
jgi:hypothetical protein